MTNEERDIITQFIARISGAQAPAQPAFGGSVPATTTPPLPPVDPEADRLIGDLFNRYPAARYRMTQLAFVQEHALAEAQNRIQRLEWELQQAQQAAQQAQEQQRAAARAAASSAACSAGVAVGAAATAGRAGTGMEPRGRSQATSRVPAGAPTTAATICAELSAGHVPALRLRVPGLGADHRGGRGGRSGCRQRADEPVLRLARRRRVRRRQAHRGGGPWGGAPADQGYVDQGTWTDPAGGGSADPGYVDSGTWDTSSNDQSSLPTTARRFWLGQRRRGSTDDTF